MTDVLIFFWVHNSVCVNRIVILRKKVFRVIYIEPGYTHISTFIKQSGIIKFNIKINMENAMFVTNLFLLFFYCLVYFCFSPVQHNYPTSWFKKDKLFRLLHYTVL